MASRIARLRRRRDHRLGAQYLLTRRRRRAPDRTHQGGVRRRRAVFRQLLGTAGGRRRPRAAAWCAIRAAASSASRAASSCTARAAITACSRASPTCSRPCTVHVDTVASLPAGSTPLAHNDMGLQAAEIRLPSGGDLLGRAISPRVQRRGDRGHGAALRRSADPRRAGEGPGRARRAGRRPAGVRCERLPTRGWRGVSAWARVDHRYPRSSWRSSATGSSATCSLTTCSCARILACCPIALLLAGCVSSMLAHKVVAAPNKSGIKPLFADWETSQARTGGVRGNLDGRSGAARRENRGGFHRAR